ncbi:MAG: sulfotransferase family protein [Candidatus Limnocylindria bacterium]
MTSHVFIVGLPRTGSTLTRGMVNASPSAWVAGESNFFSKPTRLGLVRKEGYAARFARLGDLRTDDALHRIVADIYSLRSKSFWARLQERIDASTFERRLMDTDRTPRALLDLAMEVFADGRRIRGEKTPHHIFHVPTLLDWFPDARIIHTFRDPRAVYVSLRHKERGERLSLAGRAARRLGGWYDVYAILNLARTWTQMASLHRAYERRYPDRYALVRFEDLVRSPQATAEQLAGHLGVPYQQAMLDQVVHNSSFMGKGAAAGIDPTVVDRWREVLPVRTANRIARLCSADLRYFGYEA